MNKSTDWNNDPRWRGIERTYSLGDVQRLQGSLVPEHTLARRGAEKLWELLETEPFVSALGALTGNQAVQQVQGRIEGNLSQRLAGRGRRESRRANVSRPKSLSGEQRSRSR